MVLDKLFMSNIMKSDFVDNFLKLMHFNCHADILTGSGDTGFQKAIF